MLAVGIPPVAANASNAVALVPPVSIAAWAQRRELADAGLRRLPVLALLSLGGGVAGAVLLLVTSDRAFMVAGTVPAAGRHGPVRPQPAPAGAGPRAAGHRHGGGLRLERLDRAGPAAVSWSMAAISAPGSASCCWPASPWRGSMSCASPTRSRTACRPWSTASPSRSSSARGMVVWPAALAMMAGAAARRLCRCPDRPPPAAAAVPRHRHRRRQPAHRLVLRRA